MSKISWKLSSRGFSSSFSELQNLNKHLRILTHPNSVSIMVSRVGIADRSDTAEVTKLCTPSRVQFWNLIRLLSEIYLLKGLKAFGSVALRSHLYLQMSCFIVSWSPVLKLFTFKREAAGMEISQILVKYGPYRNGWTAFPGLVRGCLQGMNSSFLVQLPKYCGPCAGLVVKLQALC